MLQHIYTWMENIAFYMVLIVAIMHMIPGENYKKYIRFFVGLILIFMMVGPILKIADMEAYSNKEYESELREIERITGEMEEMLGK